MRRDLVVTALIFAVIGFLGGYLYTQRAASPPPAPTGSGPLTAAQPTAEEVPGLPAGHPPMEIAREIVTLRQEAEKNPRDAALAFRLAELLFEVGRCDEAIPHYQRGLDLEPKNTDARVVLANCLTETGKYAEAERQLEAVLQLKPNQPHALYHLAVARLRKPDRAGAERAYQQLRQVNPNFEGLPELERMLKESRADTP